MPRPASAFARLQATAQLAKLPAQAHEESADSCEAAVQSDMLQARSADMLTTAEACPAAQSQVNDLQSCQGSLNPAHTSDGSVSEGMT